MFSNKLIHELFSSSYPNINKHKHFKISVMQNKTSQGDNEIWDNVSLDR